MCKSLAYDIKSSAPGIPLMALLKPIGEGSLNEYKSSKQSNAKGAFEKNQAEIRKVFSKKQAGFQQKNKYL